MSPEVLGTSSTQAEMLTPCLWGPLLAGPGGQWAQGEPTFLFWVFTLFTLSQGPQ